MSSIGKKRDRGETSELQEVGGWGGECVEMVVHKADEASSGQADTT